MKNARSLSIAIRKYSDFAAKIMKPWKKGDPRNYIVIIAKNLIFDF